MQRVRSGEGVVDGVPVAEVVLHVEAGDAQRGGVGEGAAELVGIRAGGERVEQGVDDALGVVVEELPGEAGHVGERAVPGGAGVDGGVEAGLGAGDELGEVVRVAPGAGLLRPRGRRGAAHEGGQHVRGGVAADVAERLEGLVGEVDGVAAVDEDVVGDGGEHHALDVAECTLSGERGGEHELGGVGGAGLDEAPVPRRETGRLVRTASVFGEVVEGAHREAGRVVAGVAGDEGEAVHEREGAVVGRERREHVGHGDEHGEAGAPAGVAVAGAEGDAAAHDLVGGDAGFEEAEHRLGQHEREAELEAVVETLEEVRDGIVAAAGLDEDVVAVDRHQEAAGVVGEGVEGAAGDEVEAGVVPVAGDQAGLDGALVEREAHVGAAVLDRPGAALTPEDDDREIADLRQQPTGGAELLERPGTCGHEFEDTGRAIDEPKVVLHGSRRCRLRTRSHFATCEPGHDSRRKKTLNLVDLSEGVRTTRDRVSIAWRRSEARSTPDVPFCVAGRRDHVNVRCAVLRGGPSA